MKFLNFSILVALALLSRACSTYETSTTISPGGELPEHYIVESQIVLNRYFPRKNRSVLSRQSGRFSVHRGTLFKSGIVYPEGTEKVQSIRILPNRDTEPKEVEVHYYRDKQPGLPALDRREWVAIPERGESG